MNIPGLQVERLAGQVTLPPGDDERFAGYGAMGVPFRGGHYLALRDMLLTSLERPYRAVWHRTPEGAWTIFTTVEPDLSCPRYFGAAAAVEQVSGIEVRWPDAWTVEVSVPGRLSWRMELAATPATRLMSAMGGGMPGWAWNRESVLASMGPMAGGFLRSGRIRLHGATPNGPRFKAAPRQVWRVSGGRATLDGEDLGPLGPLREQTRLADFWMPQRGVFFVGGARFAGPRGPVAANGA